LHMLCKLNINARVHTVAWLIFNLERIVSSVHIFEKKEKIGGVDGHKRFCVEVESRFK
jgi:hypothetical protein